MEILTLQNALPLIHQEDLSTITTHSQHVVTSRTLPWDCGQDMGRFMSLKGYDTNSRKLTDRQTNKQTNRQTDKQTDRQTNSFISCTTMNVVQQTLIDISTRNVPTFLKHFLDSFPTNPFTHQPTETHFASATTLYTKLPKHCGAWVLQTPCRPSLNQAASIFTKSFHQSAGFIDSNLWGKKTSPYFSACKNWGRV